jgi:NTE family protein
MKIASLTLSGGGSLGMAHLGALEVLEQKYDFEYYAGVSAGALVCAAHACGMEAHKLAEMIHGQKMFALLFERGQTNFGLVRGEKVLAFLHEIYQGTTFEDIERTGKKLRIYATDFNTGERVCFKSGCVAHAVRASVGIPVVFDPFEHQGRLCVDGFLSGNLPMEETLAEYAGECVGIDVCTSLCEESDLEKKSFFGKPGGIAQTVERMFRILLKHQQNFDETNERILMLRPNLTEFKSSDVRKLKEIEAIGKVAALKYFEV